MNKEQLAKHLGIYPKGLKKVYAKEQIRTVTVTPKLAFEWLSKNFEGQRAISSTHVTSLANKMRAGSFVRTPQGVIFDYYDRLIDGQHRLAAIIDSGIAVEMTVTTGVDPIIFLHIDEDGKGRNTGTHLKNQFKNPAHATAAHRIYLDYEQMDARPEGHSVRDPRRAYIAFGHRTAPVWKANREAVLSWCVEHQEAIRHVLETVYTPEAKAILPPQGCAAGFYLWVYLRWPKEADRFFAALISGANLRTDDPIYQLRMTFLKLKEQSRRTAGTGVPYFEWAALLLKGWNLFIEGKSVTKLAFTANEAWPRLSIKGGIKALPTLPALPEPPPKTTKKKAAKVSPIVAKKTTKKTTKKKAAKKKAA